MTDIGFYRSNGPALYTKGLGQFAKNLRFCNPILRCAGAMGFDVADRTRLDACPPAGLVDQSLLGSPAGAPITSTQKAFPGFSRISDWLNIAYCPLLSVTLRTG